LAIDELEDILITLDKEIRKLNMASMLTMHQLEIQKHPYKDHWEAAKEHYLFMTEQYIAARKTFREKLDRAKVRQRRHKKITLDDWKKTKHPHVSLTFQLLKEAEPGEDPPEKMDEHLMESDVDSSPERPPYSPMGIPSTDPPAGTSADPSTGELRPS
jgi:hypothetical protein